MSFTKEETDANSSNGQALAKKHTWLSLSTNKIPGVQGRTWSYLDIWRTQLGVIA